MACSARHHKWAVNPPTAGTPCVKCERVFGDAPPRDGPRAAGAAPQLGEERAARLAAILSAPSPSNLSTGSPNSTGQVTSPSSPGNAASGSEETSPPSGWLLIVADRLAHVLIDATAAAGKKWRVAKVPDEDLIADLSLGIAEELQKWFSDVEPTGWKRGAAAMMWIVLGMYVGAPRPSEQQQQPAPALPVRAGSAPAPTSVVPDAPTASPPTTDDPIPFAPPTRTTDEITARPPQTAHAPTANGSIEADFQGGAALIPPTAGA